MVVNGSIPHKPEEDSSNESAKESAGVDVRADLPTLRTYKADVQHAMQDERTSLVKIVLEEERKKQKHREEESPKAKKNLPLIVISSVLLIASIWIIYFVFIGKGMTDEEKTLATLNVRPIIFVEKNREIPVDTGNAAGEQAARKAILDVISGEKLTLDTIEYIFFTETTSVETREGIVEQKNIVGSGRLFSFINLGMPAILHRALGPDYMFGIHYFNENSPFFILTTEYYDNAFAGMLSWERQMAQNLLPFFGKTGLVRELSERRFEDLIIKNNDVRAIRSFEGKIELVYTFKDEKTLVITTNEDTLLELSRRIDLSRGRK